MENQGVDARSQLEESSSASSNLEKPVFWGVVFVLIVAIVGVGAYMFGKSTVENNENTGDLDVTESQTDLSETQASVEPIDPASLEWVEYGGGECISADLRRFKYPVGSQMREEEAEWSCTLRITYSDGDTEFEIVLSNYWGAAGGYPISVYSPHAFVYMKSESGTEEGWDLEGKEGVVRFEDSDSYWAYSSYVTPVTRMTYPIRVSFPRGESEIYKDVADYVGCSLYGVEPNAEEYGKVWFDTDLVNGGINGVVVRNSLGTTSTILSSSDLGGNEGFDRHEVNGSQDKVWISLGIYKQSGDMRPFTTPYQFKVYDLELEEFISIDGKNVFEGDPMWVGDDMIYVSMGEDAPDGSYVHTYFKMDLIENTLTEITYEEHSTATGL